MTTCLHSGQGGLSECRLSYSWSAAYWHVSCVYHRVLLQVLIVCPERYLKPMIPNSTRFAKLQRRRTVLSETSLNTIQEWDRKGSLYR